MALEFVGGALLSALLEAAFDKLTSTDMLDYFRGKRFDDKLLEKLNVSLLSIKVVIDDAEEKHISNRHVSAWLDKVKDVVLDAEDVLDEIHTEASKQKKLQDDQQFHSGKVWCCFIPSSFSSISSSFDKDVQSRLKEILDNLELLSSKKETLGLKESGGGSGFGFMFGNKTSQRLPTTSLVNEAGVYGRDCDKNFIIDLLLSHSDNGSSGSNMIVNSIVGMGGIGKTTLAQLVYNDKRVNDAFAFKAWVSVSEEFDVVKVTRTILKALNLYIDDTMDLNMLQVKLKEKLLGKKFFLVLDDVWNENYLNWEALRTPFVYGAHGSKILVTTRSEKVASTMRSANLLQLKQLPKEESWLLFAKHAFHDGESQPDAELEKIGRKIIEKCKGLPLALKTIGSLLYTKLSYEEWNGVLTSEMWDISDDASNIIPALRLSYQYLPSPLKRCFAYCSLLPKDYEFDKDYLVDLWMAESFLQFHQQNKSMKELGDQFFDELLSRSFFQRSSGEEKQFVMHDLVNDLAKYVSGEFCLRLEEEEEAKDVSKMTRHFSYFRNHSQVSKRLEAIYKANKLRTFLPFPTFGSEAYDPSLMSSNMVHVLLSKFKCLRAFSLCGYFNIYELPDSIGNLKHLRYLDLSGTGVKKLPESICLLYNLQTLKLTDCLNLEELPYNMHKLINLCHLDFRGTKVRKLPNGLGELQNLEVLSSFYVGKCGESNINQLAALKLRGTLSIKELQNVANPLDALTANLKNKVHLEGLILEWSMNEDGSLNERNVLEKLQPHTNLRKLSIRNYAGTTLPDWFGDDYLSNIVSLELSDCKHFCFLPPLGVLPSLKRLWIVGLEKIVVIGSQFYGNNSCVVPFGSLQVLGFRKMFAWEKWDCQNASGAFPCLKELHITDCPRLKNSLPEHLPSLLELKIFNCIQLTASLPRAPAIHGLVLEDCGKLQWKSLPSSLKTLLIGGGSIERSLLEETMHTISNTCLEKLVFRDHPNAEFPICHYHNFLRIMVLSSCNSLRALPLDFFPRLETLDLEYCSNLERFSISDRLDNPSLTSLKELRVWGCPEFISLEQCSIRNSDSLKSFPRGMHALFPSLTSILLNSCRKLECPEGGFPSSIEKLGISNCPKLVASSMKWELNSCIFLTQIDISDKNVESFPDQGLLLPATLSSLSINRCSNLKTLHHKGFRHLSSLKHLSIRQCPRLLCLPKEGLPGSLSCLEIRGNCPLLKQRCQKHRGEDWSKIGHIPCIRIDNDIIT
ncbi:hypothetical protein Lal_00032930 [Lupinus albus]|uniref:Putative winged helix-turn-helix DNA-binding domain, leucine-rich repeat domain, L n=1 Tax=Lupinus albus TaxID=3870 RepID=A0A6A4RAK9_LUPAL|nr:putative winged helix-turn-helix DNA-binding domain, leucine-rich repeat domain, L [Lupinus albus]KAF1898165.1 hypothetical protein Lal_00032930 [Lupinus albus]